MDFQRIHVANDYCKTKSETNDKIVANYFHRIGGCGIILHLLLAAIYHA
jgi:hypothetical protein